jgi:hypothetical protein
MTIYQSTPFTLDNNPIPADAPRSQGMDDTAAAAVSDAQDAHAQAAMSLTVDVDQATRAATATVDNPPENARVMVDWGDGQSDYLDPAEFPSETETHDYIADGTYIVTASADTPPERVWVEIAVNWPAPFPGSPVEPPPPEEPPEDIA